MNIEQFETVSMVDGKSNWPEAVDLDFLVGQVSVQEQEKTAEETIEINVHRRLVSDKEEVKATSNQLAILTLKEAHKPIDFFVRLLSSDANFVHEIAANSLANMAEIRENGPLLLATEGLLEGITRLLHGYSSRKAQEEAARIAANLALSDKIEILDGMIPLFLPSLARLLYKDGDPTAQNQAIRALGNFARSPYGKFVISQYPGALEGMVRLVSGEFDYRTQQIAATAVANVCAK